MTPQQIKDNAPHGATHYAKVNNKIHYFFKSSYGFRAIKGNLLQFDSSNIDNLIKPL